MNIKVVFFIVLLLFPSFLYGQNKVIVEKIVITGQESPYTEIVTNNIHFDVVTLQPVFKIVTDSITGIKKKTHYFYRYKGREREVISNIFYEGGQSVF